MAFSAAELKATSKPKLLDHSLEAFHKTAKSVEDPSTQEMLLKLLERFVKLIKEDEALGSQLFISLDKIDDVEQEIKEIEKHMSTICLNTTNKRRAEAFLGGLSKNLPLYRELHPRKKTYLPDFDPAIPPDWLFQSLRIQQEKLLANADFKEALNEINEKARFKGLIPGQLYMCYAHSPNNNLPIDIFVRDLYHILRLTGYWPIAYFSDAYAGGGVAGYMSQIEDPKIQVLLLGTKDLLEGTSFKTERSHIRRKLENHGKVIPILISGHETTSFPPELLGSVISRSDWLNPERSYLQNLIILIENLYKTKDTFNDILTNFKRKNTDNDNLTKVLDINKTLEHLTAEKNAEARNEAARYQASAALLGLSSNTAHVSRMGLLSGTRVSSPAAPPTDSSYRYK